MSAREEILKHQGVLTEAKLCAGENSSGDDPSVAGNFEDRLAEFGVRKAKDDSAAVFFKVRVRLTEGFPLPPSEDCQVVFPEGSKFENADIRIEGGQWLTEVVSSDERPERYFAAQTDASIKDRLTALSQLALRMGAGDFSLQPSIDAHVKKNVRRLSWLMVGGFAVIVLSVVAVSVPFFFRPLGIPEVKEGSSSNATLRSTRVARAQAEFARRERSIVPPGSNVYLMVTPDKTTVSLGEKVTLLYEVLTRYSAKCWGFNNEGKFQNFKVERKDAPTNTPRVVVQANGKKFLKFAVGTAAIVPRRLGEQFIYPGTAFVSARAESGQILDVFLTTKPMAINVVKDPGQEQE